MTPKDMQYQLLGMGSFEEPVAGIPTELTPVSTGHPDTAIKDCMRYGSVQMLPNICHDDHLAGTIPVKIDPDTPVRRG